MKLRNLLAMTLVAATGLTLASCGQNKVYTGIGYSGEFGLSYGNYQLDLSTAFAAFDSKGKIVDARIDVVQVKVKANAENTGVELVSAQVDGSVRSKLELGKDYNMLSSSEIGKEVDAQIEAFADWTVGKTVEEVKSLIDPTKGHGVAHHADLEGICTITCTAFVEALEVAYANRSAEAVSVSKTAKAGIAMVSGLAYNYGAPQTDISVDVAGVLVDGGKVVAAEIDAVVYPLSISAEGVAADTTQKYFQNGKLTSKNTLGDKYAMAERNNGQDGCTLEWYEQAAVIEAAANGKTATEIATLKKAEGELATATITLASYVTALSKAAKYAELTHVGPQA